MRKWSPPQTGIELAIGRPGAGKSLWAVKRALKIMLEQRRPVYSNLPFVLPVIRKYLRNRGGESYANLIHELSEEHFRRFCARYAAWRAHKEKWIGERPGQMICREDMRAAFVDVLGGEVTKGEKANWIPSGAVVILDEVQHWFPNPALSNQRDKVEPGSLMSYLTMHRHMLHWVMVLTQAERQISTTFKSLATKIWEISRYDEERVAWAITWGDISGVIQMLGGPQIVALLYKAYTPEQMQRGEPMERYVDWPTAPWNRKYFRFYKSFTHADGERQLKEGLREAQASAGVAVQPKKIEDEDMPKKKTRKAWGCLVGMMKMAGLGVLFLFAIAIGTTLGGGGGESVPVAQVGGLGDSGVITGRVVGMSPDHVRFDDGRRYRTGQRRNGYQLIAFDAVAGITVWDNGDDVWVFRIGEEPQRMGSTAAIVQAIERTAGSRAGAAPVAIPGGGAAGR